MIRKIQIAFALSMGVIAGVMLAQTEADFQGWMKQIAATNGKLKAGVAAKDKAAVTEAAKIMEDSFKQVGAFLGKMNFQDAVEWASANTKAAAAITAAANEGNFDEAEKQAGVIAGSCNTCHSVHREGAKGGPYKIK